VGELPKSDNTDTGFEYLLQPFNGICWWCRQRPADSREHKYKRSDLARMWEKEGLLWGTGDGETQLIRGIDRNRRVKFTKIMCSPCDNARSQPFDLAYAVFSDYVAANHEKLWHQSGINFVDIYGGTWQSSQLDMAKYYGKHFRCRLVQAGLPVPDSLRAFLDGASDMPDIQFGLVSNEAIGRTSPRVGDCF
jgi:hypothetical protein